MLYIDDDAAGIDITMVVGYETAVQLPTRRHWMLMLRLGTVMGCYGILMVPVAVPGCGHCRSSAYHKIPDQHPACQTPHSMPAMHKAEEQTLCKDT